MSKYIEPTFGLTPRQLDVLRFLADYKEANEVYPTFRDIATALNIKSISHVGKLLDQLQSRGHIERLPNIARAFRILYWPTRK